MWHDSVLLHYQTSLEFSTLEISPFFPMLCDVFCFSARCTDMSLPCTWSTKHVSSPLSPRAAPFSLVGSRRRVVLVSSVAMSASDATVTGTFLYLQHLRAKYNCCLISNHRVLWKKYQVLFLTKLMYMYHWQGSGIALFQRKDIATKILPKKH